MADFLGFFLVEKIEVLLDNEIAGARLALETLGTLDYEITLEFNRLCTGVGKLVEVCWVLGYQDIPGNEAADCLAKEGAELLLL